MTANTFRYIDKFSNSMSNDGSQKWLTKLEQVIERSATNHAIDNVQLAKKLELSERHLIRKVNEITGLSPQKYLRNFRLKKAYTFIKSGKYKTVKETAHAVGYTNVSYFIMQFEKKYNKRPLELLREFGWR